MRTGFVSLMVVCSAAWALAQPPVDPITVVAPYLDDQALAVLRVDLARIDMNLVAKRWASLVGAGEAGDELQSTMLAKAAQLKAAGATTVFLIISGNDIFPVVVIPMAAGADTGKIQAAVKAVTGFPDMTAEQRGSTLAVAKPATWKRLKSMQAVARADLAAALADGKDAEVCLAVGFGSDIRKAFEETTPKLPDSFGGGASTAVTRGLKWGSAQMRTAPKLDVTANVQASDANAAKRLQEMWQAWTKSMTQPPPNESKDQAVMHAATKLAAAQVTGDRLVIRVDEAMMERDLPALSKRVRQAAHRTQSNNNLRQLALALHSYHDATNGKFPTDIYDKDGKPLLSWRVQVLPFIEGGNVAQAIRMDEPWDSEHNRQFLAKIPKAFVAPGQKSPAGTTTYLSTIGEKFMFAPQPNGPPRGIRDIVDGTSQTIMIVETGDEMAVPWTKPGDLTPTEKDPIRGLLGHYTDGFYIALGDGSSKFIRKDIDLKDLYGMFTINGNETIKEFSR